MNFFSVSNFRTAALILKLDIYHAIFQYFSASFAMHVLQLHRNFSCFSKKKVRYFGTCIICASFGRGIFVEHVLSMVRCQFLRATFLHILVTA